MDPNSALKNADIYLTVRGLLCQHYGKYRGAEIFDLLYRVAAEHSKVDTIPSILFDSPDGTFADMEWLSNKEADEDEEDDGRIGYMSYESHPEHWSSEEEAENDQDPLFPDDIEDDGL